MQISSSKTGNITIVAPTGSVDALTSNELSQYMTAQVRGGAVFVVLDLTSVDYMTSTGLRVILMSLHETRQAGGDLRLAGPVEDVRKVLDMSGFTSIVKTYPDVAAAVDGFA